MKPPRGLSDAEQAAWAKLAESVTPFAGRTIPKLPDKSRNQLHGRKASPPLGEGPGVGARRPSQGPNRPTQPSVVRIGPDLSHGLDSHQDRRFRGGAIAPDFTLDLHGLTLDQAYDRLQGGVAQARSMGARVVLVIAGKPRPVEAADRGTSRGAIRAKLLDWLAAGPHADAIAAVRKAHRRHGGEGALYLVLRRGR